MLNMGARLMAEAQPGEIVVSNCFYQALDDDAQSQFAENQPVIAKNIGTLKSWRRHVPGDARAGGSQSCRYSRFATPGNCSPIAT
jgi:class 3 adenylate cyclase